MAIEKITKLDNFDEVNGTSLVGFVNTQYETLVELFGEPMAGYDYKTDAEWTLKINTDTGETLVATIYNWKNGKSYLGEEGTPTEQITRWNIGGHDRTAAFLVSDAVRYKIAAQ
jgi:hypothetical protein